jgi:hypothetical protein
MNYSQVKDKVTCGQSVSLGVEPNLGLFAIWQLRSSFCGAPSLTRGRVCLLHMLLALASAVFLGSESRGARDRILLSQIWDFAFHHLLWHAGSRWRYSTPPPHGSWIYTHNSRLIPYVASAQTAKETPLPTVTKLLSVTQPLPNSGIFSVLFCE